jgi:UTP--glucose-1-phosphate uridylyltransferase
MTGYPLQFEPFARLMKAEGLPDIFIRNFAYYYDRLLAGEDGMIAENEIQPVRALDNSDCLPDHLVRLGLDTAGRTVIIKLNGGLGTSMGLTAAKSLLMVKDGLNVPGHYCPSGDSGRLTACSE